ncbi:MULTISPECIES: transposase [Alphaproteobacteria]|uniref:transposase n=1 Tax=Alphaproteobacteria TaxID=28211 RepID=UPI0032650CDC
MARVVVPGFAHHVTQRGNRRQTTFFSDTDYAAYLEIPADALPRARVALQAYCLMPNHVHLILAPETTDGLAKALEEIHQRYTHTGSIGGKAGAVIFGRAGSPPSRSTMRISSLRRAMWSSTRYARDLPHGRKTGPGQARARAPLSRVPEKRTAADLILTSDLPDMIGDWRLFLDGGIAPELTDLIRQHERTGRPLGSDGFLKDLEQRLGRRLRKRKPGPKTGATEP